MKDNISPPLDCYSMDDALSLQSVAALATPNSVPPFKPDDFAAIDLDANQMHKEDGQLFILAFVNNDEPVTFKTSEGMFDLPSGRLRAADGYATPRMRTAMATVCGMTAS